MLDAMSDQESHNIAKAIIVNTFKQKQIIRRGQRRADLRLVILPGGPREMFQFVAEASCRR